MNSIKKMLGLFLAVTMIAGGLSPVMPSAEASIQKQLDTGVSIENISCKNPDHKLAIRDNNKPLCATQKLLDRLGLDEIAQIGSNHKITTDTAASDRIITSFGNSKLNGHSSGGIIDWPRISYIIFPEQVRFGEPFTVNMTYSWVEYEFDENGNHVIDETTGEYKILDEPFYDHQKKDTRVYMSRSQGIDILSSDFEFEKDFPSALNLLDVPFRMHGLDVQFDPVKLHTSSVVLKVDSLPSKISNAIGFQSSIGHESHVYMYDNGDNTISPTDQKRPITLGANDLSSTSVPAMTKDDPGYEEDMRAVESMHNGTRLDIVDDIADRYRSLDDDFDLKMEILFSGFYTQSFFDVLFQRHPDLLDDKKTQSIYSGWIELEPEYKETYNYDKKESDSKLNTQNFLPSLNWVLPFAYASSSDITIYGKSVLINADTKNLGNAKNIKVCAFEYNEFKPTLKQKFDNRSICTKTDKSGIYFLNIPNNDMDRVGSHPDVIVTFTLEYDGYLENY